MFKRLTLTMLVLLLIAVAAVGAVALTELYNVNEENTHKYLVAAASALQAAIGDEEDVVPECEELAGVFERSFESPIRVTVIRRDGEVLFDNNINEADAENHRDRPEVKAVLHGARAAQDIRFSVSQKRDLMYYAVSAEDGQTVIRVALPLAWRQQVFLHLSGKLIWVLVMAVILAMLTAFIVSRRYTSTLEVVCRGAAKMRDGDYGTRIPSANRRYFTEIRQLTDAFNEMAASLEDQHKLLEAKNARLNAILNAMMDPLLLIDCEHNLLYANRVALKVFGRDLDPEQHAYPQILLTHAKVLDDIIERGLKSPKTLETELALSTAAGERCYKVQVVPIYSRGEAQGVVIGLHDLTAEEEAGNLRRDFAANVTHELKTPLTSIRGFVDTLRRSPDMPPEKKDRFLEIIDLEGARLEGLINDILSLAEIEREKPQDVDNFDLNELIDEVLVLLDDRAAERRIALVALSEEEETLPVRAERDRIKQVIINLVDNAIKYGHMGGRVEVSAERDSAGRIQLKVEDDGPGIPPEAAKRIFERFYRIDKGRSRELGGTGLGLSIVKHIALRYGGEARVEQRPEGGSRFIVTMNI